MRRDVDLQNTQLVLFKPPRDVLQINILSQHLGLRSQLKEWYQDATSVPCGYLFNDLTPKTVDSLRYCSNGGSVPTIFFTRGNRDKLLDDEYTIRLYSPNNSKFVTRTSRTIYSQLFERFHSVSERVFSKPIKRRASRPLDRRHSKISKKKFRTNTKKILYTKQEFFKFS